jgi:hypothetical protein
VTFPSTSASKDLVVGDGDEAVSGRKVTVHYVGVAFSTGDEFDASWDRGQPFEFKLGQTVDLPIPASPSRRIARGLGSAAPSSRSVAASSRSRPTMEC